MIIEPEQPIWHALEIHHVLLDENSMIVGLSGRMPSSVPWKLTFSEAVRLQGEGQKFRYTLSATTSLEIILGHEDGVPLVYASTMPGRERISLPSRSMV